MRIVIAFDTDNAAFADDFEGSVADALQQAYRKLLSQRTTIAATHCTHAEADDKVLDINGNTIGSCQLLNAKKRRKH